MIRSLTRCDENATAHLRPNEKRATRRHSDLAGASCRHDSNALSRKAVAHFQPRAGDNATASVTGSLADPGRIEGTSRQMQNPPQVGAIDPFDCAQGRLSIAVVRQLPD